MKKVYLYGALSSKFGKEFTLDVCSLPEALRAIDANQDGFLNYLINSCNKGVGYSFFSENINPKNNEDDVKNKLICGSNPDQLDLIKNELHIMPVTQGGGFVGTAISMAINFFTSEAFFQAVLLAAVSYGIAELTKPPDPPKIDDKRISTKSYILNGPQNREAQGIPIPVAYGQLKIGTVGIGLEKQIKRRDNADFTQGGNQDYIIASYSKFRHLDLLCEGPIEGLVDEGGNLINVGESMIGEFVDKEDLGKALYLNDVPVKSSNDQLNYIMTEDAENAIDYKKGIVGETFNLDGEKNFDDPSIGPCFSRGYDILLHGTTPLVGGVAYELALTAARQNTDGEYKGEIDFAIKHGAKVASHMVNSEHIKEIDLCFQTELAFNRVIEGGDQDGQQTTMQNACRFVIMVQRNGVDYNVLDRDSGCAFEIDPGFAPIRFNDNGTPRGGIAALVAIPKAKFGYDTWQNEKNTDAAQAREVVPLHDEDALSDWVKSYNGSQGDQVYYQIITKSLENYVDKNQDIFDAYKNLVKTDYFEIAGIATAATEFSIKIKINWDYFQRNDIDKNRGIVFKVLKLDPEIDPSSSDTKTKNASGLNSKRSLRFSYVQEKINARLSYPHTAIASVLIDSRNFSSVPSRMYHGKFKKILVPSNYNSKTRKYDGPWDGRFKGQVGNQSLYDIDDSQLVWSDNPAWIFFDLMINPRFGVAKYGVSDLDIDKWQLYKIAKYCDELVDTEYEIENKEGVARAFRTDNVVHQDKNTGDGYIELMLAKYFWYLNESGELVLMDKYFSDPNYVPSGVSNRQSNLTELNIDIIFQDMLNRSSSDGDKSSYLAVNDQGESILKVGDLIDHLLSSGEFLKPVFSRDDFVNEFGEGSGFQGKKIAIFLADHNYAAYSEVSAKAIQRKSCTRSGSYQIEERIIISSDPDQRKVNISGPNLLESGTDINGITYGACAAQINHPVVEPRFTCNVYLSDKSNALSIMNAMSSVFRGIISYYGGRISPVQDGPKKPVKIFNNSNVSKEGFIYTGGAKNKKYTSCVVRFNNKEKSFKPDIIFQEDVRGIQRLGFVEKEVIGFGITSPAQARRLARWTLMTPHVENDIIKFNTAIEGNLLAPGLIFEVSDDLRSGSAKSGRIMSIDMHREFDGMQIMDPSISLDHSLSGFPIFSRLEVAISGGKPSQRYQDIDRRAQAEKNATEQDIEISNLFSQQIFRFECSVVQFEDDRGAKRAKLVNLMFKQDFEVSLKDNKIKSMFHGLSNGDKVRFVTAGVLPGGINKNRIREKAYTVVNKTDHTFQILEYNSAEPVNILDEGRDSLRNIGGMHYFCKENSRTLSALSFPPMREQVSDKTIEALNQLSEGSTYSISGLISLKEDPLSDIIFNQDQLDNLKINNSLQLRSRDYAESDILGLISVISENWVYAAGLGWVYVKDAADADSSSEGIWFFIQEMGWIFIPRNDDNWWYVKYHETLPVMSDWIFINRSNNGSYVDDPTVKEIWLPDSNARSDKLGEGTFLGGTNDNPQGKEVKIIKVLTGSNPGYWVSLTEKTVQGSDPVPTSSPGSISQQSQNENPGLQESPITEFQRIHAINALQDKNSVRIQVANIDEINLSENFDIEISGVSHATDSSIDAKMNKTMSVVYIENGVLEIINSDALYDDIAAVGDDFATTGAISLISGVDLVKKQNQGSKLYRTLSVKEINNNEFEITGGEYNPSKFKAIDEVQNLRKPFIPIPPQVDMDIPSAPINLILTDLTYRVNSSSGSGSSGYGSGATSSSSSSSGY
jgi:predicted phage tail protein